VDADEQEQHRHCADDEQCRHRIAREIAATKSAV
jgi:hypothetical protein